MSSFGFYNLSGNTSKSCNVISFRDTLIMVDCTLDFMSTLGYMPLSLTHNHQLSSLPSWRPTKDQLKLGNFNYKESRTIDYEVKECHSGVHCVDSTPEFALFDTTTVDLTKIDVILISNYFNMFGLPYLTERFDFDGVIYLTEPTYHFGRIMMEEVIKLIEATPKPKRQNLWKRIHDQLNLSIPRNNTMNCDPNTWLPIFTSKELNSCLSKVKIVNYSQAIDIFGLFEVSAHSSGFCIGSCNWVFKSDHEKIVYMSQTSKISSHPKPFEAQPLQNADVMLLTNLNAAPQSNPDAMLGDFSTHTIQTLKNEGNVLVPCYPCGTVYDLIEYTAVQLTAANLAQVPIYFLSPVAEASLAYANILGEWLTPAKQSKVFVPEEPFIHSCLVRAGRLKHFSGVSDPAFSEAFKTPCVIFTSHPSLRFGDAVHFLQLWGQSSKNLLILTEPDYPCQLTINPFLPLAMKVLYIPIDINWNIKQFNNHITQDLKPNHLVLHHNSVSNLAIGYHNDGSGESANNTAIHPYGVEKYLNLATVRSNFQRINIDPALAGQILPNEIRPGVLFATINGSLVARDNKYTLYPVAQGQALPASCYYYGNVNLPLLVELLARSGIADATVEGSNSSKIIELRSIRAVIHVEESQTHIITADMNTRLRLRALIASCLKKF